MTAEMADAQRQELALVVERELDVAVGVAGMVVADEGFVSPRHPEHRPADLLRADQHRDVFRIGAGLEPERAADLLGGDADFRRRNAHDARHRVAHGARALRADAEQIAVVGRVVARGAAARLHRGDVDALVHERDARDMGGRLHRRVDLRRHLVGIGGKPRPVDRDVARRFRPHLRRAGLDRLAQIGHRIERRILHLDRLGAVLGRREASRRSPWRPPRRCGARARRPAPAGPA